MQCLMCERFNLTLICQRCLNSLKIRPITRTLDCGLKVYSFFELNDIAPLLYSKYDIIGSKVLTLLARHCAKYFFSKTHIPIKTIAIGVDDVPRKYYAHTAIITKEFCKASHKKLQPLYNALIATNPISYAGKNLEFRQNNPRNFIYKGKIHNTEAIIFDDIITSGITLTQAYQCLQSHNIKTLFALTIADARTF